MPKHDSETSSKKSGRRLDPPLVQGALPVQPIRSGASDGEVLAWLLLGLFALSVLGFYLMRLPGSDEGSPLNSDRAGFGVVSAVTLTGLQQDLRSSPFAADSKLMPATLLILTVGSSFLTLVLTGLPTCRLLGITRNAKPVLLAAAAIVVGGTLLGGLPFLLTYAPIGAEGAKQLPWLDAFLTSASAVGNSGVYWARLPRADGWTTHAIVLPLALIGGFGVPVVLDLYDRLTGRTVELRSHTKLVFGLAAGVYIAGVVLLLAFDERFISTIIAGIKGGGWTPPQGKLLRTLVVEASVFSLNSRSLGLPLEPASVAALPRAASWILLMLMAIGGAPGGTAGGLKITSLFLLSRGARRGMQGERQPIECGFAVAWALLFALLIAVGYAGLLWAAPEVPAERLLFMTVSAASNSGLSHDALSLVLTPLIMLTLIMALGRVVPILLLWRMAGRVDHAETVAA